MVPPNKPELLLLGSQTNSSLVVMSLKKLFIQHCFTHYALIFIQFEQNMTLLHRTDVYANIFTHLKDEPVSECTGALRKTK